MRGAMKQLARMSICCCAGLAGFAAVAHTGNEGGGGGKGVVCRIPMDPLGVSKF